jgi:glycosyltransferase involved in cell wall biosynthesis
MAPASEPVPADLPTVSVVIPCYNQGTFVREALDSVFAQTWKNWEVVIVNDGSSDGTARVLDSIDHPSVRVIHQENRGLPEARNAGVRASRGEYFLPLDADDLIHPELIEACARVLLAEPALGFCYTDLRTFGEETAVRRHGPYNFHRQLLYNDVTVTALVRKRAWEAAGGYDPRGPAGAEDWDFWLRCGKQGWHGRLVRRPLFLYRLRAGSMWSLARTRMDAIKAQLRALHPDLYSPEGMARVRAEWFSVLDIHHPESCFARIASWLPGPVHAGLLGLYRRLRDHGPRSRSG